MWKRLKHYEYLRKFVSYLLKKKTQNLTGSWHRRNGVSWGDPRGPGFESRPKPAGLTMYYDHFWKRDSKLRQVTAKGYYTKSVTSKIGYLEIIQFKHFEVPYSAKWPIEVTLNLKVTPFCEVTLALLCNYTSLCTTTFPNWPLEIISKWPFLWSTTNCNINKLSNAYLRLNWYFFAITDYRSKFERESFRFSHARNLWDRELFTIDK